MDHARHLRDGAAEFADRAAAPNDPLAHQVFSELAVMRRECAERQESCATALKPVSDVAS